MALYGYSEKILAENGWLSKATRFGRKIESQNTTCEFPRNQSQSTSGTMNDGNILETGDRLET